MKVDTLDTKGMAFISYNDILKLKRLIPKYQMTNSGKNKKKLAEEIKDLGKSMHRTLTEYLIFWQDKRDQAKNRIAWRRANIVIKDMIDGWHVIKNHVAHEIGVSL